MSTTFISYFDRYPEFDHHPRRSIRDEFNRLAKSLKWDRAESARQRANCYNDELEGHFALLGITEKLERLQYLCDELGVEPRRTVAKCKRILKKTHVNLVDLMDSRRNNTKVEKFKTLEELKKYTKNTGKIYPLEFAKGDVVETLLRRITSKKK